MTRAADAIASAERWIGTTEQPANSNRVAGITDWYGLIGPWCAMGLSRWFFDAGLPLPASTAKGFAYTPSGAAWFKAIGRWGATPQVGAVVFFDFPGDGVNRISHVGLVTGVNADGSIETIEGNTDDAGGRTGGKVMRKRRKVGIVGYGYPTYDDQPTPPPPLPTPPPPLPTPPHSSPAPGLAVDGVPGRRTWARVQESLNRTGANPQLLVDGDPGKKTYGALQARVNYLLVTAGQPGISIDGIPGRQTWRGVQWVVGVPRDGEPGPITWRAIQRRLNAGEL